MRDKRNSCGVLVGKSEGKRPLEINKRVSGNNIKTKLIET
jgi:hypothetical protein